LIKNSDGNTVKTIPVKVQHFKETKWLISGNVIDAEFSKSLNRLVIVTSEPNELRVCNTADNTMRTLALNKTPKCISISPDGKKAAVGYDGAMSYIDLNSVSEISYNTVAANAFDIVLTDNSWVYVTPWEDQWCNISCYNLQTGQETLSQGTLYERTNIKLHPSGKYLYTAENGLSPSDIEKYDIQNGTAKYLYDSPYHGDYPFSGNLWFMEDGTRLISRGKTVLKLSENKDSDLRYAGSINADGQIISLDHRASINKICAIMSQSYNYDPKPSNKISFFEATYLNFEKSITLPDFSVPDGKGGQKFFKSNAKYCFFNSDGSNYIVIMQAEEGMPTLDTWAIYSKKL
jgi:hypothetical protein